MVFSVSKVDVLGELRARRCRLVKGLAKSVDSLDLRKGVIAEGSPVSLDYVRGRVLRVISIDYEARDSHNFSSRCYNNTKRDKP